jgi:hypothetical protein
MMNSIERGILAAALAAMTLVALAAQRPVNNCVTPDGRTVYGDDADQCKNAPIRKLDRDGTPRDVIPTPPTDEQRKLKEEIERKQTRCHERNKEQYQSDDALLGRYPSEDDLEEARYGALGHQIKLVNEANERLKVLIARGRAYAEEAKFFEPPHQVPDKLKRDRGLNRESERIEFRRIAGAAREILRINDDYDATLKRYRELVDGTARMPCDPNAD